MSATNSPKTLCACSLALMAALLLVAPAFAQQRAEPEAPADTPLSRSGALSAQTGDGADAAVPRLIKFSGELRSGDAGLALRESGEVGPPGPSLVGVTFAIYAEQHGGSPLWMETQNVAVDEQGRYSVLLGATKSGGLPLELFSTGEARWLAIEPADGDQSAAGGRVLLVSVPYALKAADADSLGGRPASEFVHTEKLETTVREAVSTQVAKELESQSTEKDGETSPQINEGPSTFIGTNTTQIVQVTQLGTGAALRGDSPGTSALIGVTTHSTGRGIFGVALATGDTRAFGMLGRSDSLQGVGFQGTATSVTGASIGVQGFAFSTSGIAFAGTASATSGSTMGVSAEVRSAAGVAGRFRNTNIAGKLLSGIGGSAEVFSVDGTGSLRANEFRDLSGNRVASTAGMVRGINLLVGCETCDLLTDNDDQPNFYFNVIGTMTLTEVRCFSDAGTPTINLQREGAGSTVLPLAMSCSTSGSTATTFNSGQDTLNLGDRLNFLLVSAGTSTRRLTVVIKAVVN